MGVILFLSFLGKRKWSGTESTITEATYWPIVPRPGCGDIYFNHIDMLNKNVVELRISLLWRCLLWETKLCALQSSTVTVSLLALCLTDRESTKSLGSTVSIAIGYRLDDRVVAFEVPVGSRVLISRYRPDRMWVPPGHLLQGFFPGVKRASAWSWPLTYN
jgi:hypothetical protein